MHSIFESFLRDLKTHQADTELSRIQFYHSICWRTCKGIVTALEKLQIAESCIETSYKLPIEDHEVPRYIEFHIENYIIRSRSVYDRVLIFTNYLCDIQLAPDRVTHALIVTNEKVKKSGLKNSLKAINTVCGTYRIERNEIIHQGKYSDKNLDKLDLLQKAIFVTDGDYQRFDLTEEQIALFTAEVIDRHLDKFKKHTEIINEKINDFFSLAKEVYDSHAIV